MSSFLRKSWQSQADDDSYIFVDNLRDFLGPFSPNERLYFGFPYLNRDFGTYMSGGSGYILSRESLKQLHGQILSRGDLFQDFFSKSVFLSHTLIDLTDP